MCKSTCEVRRIPSVSALFFGGKATAELRALGPRDCFDARGRGSGRSARAHGNCECARGADVTYSLEHRGDSGVRALAMCLRLSRSPTMMPCTF